jgi:hypothetical protein
MDSLTLIQSFSSVFTEGAKSIVVLSSSVAWNAAATKYCTEGIGSISGRASRSVKSILMPFVPVRDKVIRIYVLGSFVVYEVGTTFVAVGFKEGVEGAKYYGEVGGEYGKVIGEFFAPLIAKIIESMSKPFPITIPGTSVSMDDLLKVGMKVNGLLNPLVNSNMVRDVFKQYPSQFSKIRSSLAKYPTMSPDESILPSANKTSEGEKLDSGLLKQICQKLLESQAPEIGRYVGGMVGYGIGAAGGFAICGLRGGMLSIPRAVVRGLKKGTNVLRKRIRVQSPTKNRPLTTTLVTHRLRSKPHHILATHTHWMETSVTF